MVCLQHNSFQPVTFNGADSDPDSFSEFGKKKIVLHIVRILAHVLLFVVIVKVSDSTGGVQLCRAFLILEIKHVYIKK